MAKIAEDGQITGQDIDWTEDGNAGENEEDVTEEDDIEEADEPDREPETGRTS